MSLVKCNECNKTISSNSQICVHCGNPLVNVENKNEYISYYDLSDKEKDNLRKEFDKKAGTRLKKVSNIGLIVLCTIKAFFWLLGLITSLSQLSLLKNFGFYFFIVCIIDFILSYFWINKGLRDMDDEFSVWLCVSKHIKK